MTNLDIAERERLITILAENLVRDEPGLDQYWLKIPACSFSDERLAVRFEGAGMALIGIERPERGPYRITFLRKGDTYILLTQ